MRSTIIVSIIMLCLGFASWQAMAQKELPMTGDFSIMQSQKQINVVFRYDKMKIGEFPDEEDYIKHRMKEYETKKAGKGAEWLREWKEIRVNAENSFVKGMNKKLKKLGIYFCLENETASYTLILEANSLEIGWSGGFVSAAAVMRWNISLCKTDDLTHPVASIETFGVGDAESVKKRLASTYLSTAYRFAKILRKRVFK